MFGTDTVPEPSLHCSTIHSSFELLQYQPSPEMAGFLNRISNEYNFNPQTSIPDLSGKVIVVTGGNTGLGYQTVLQLAQHGPSRIFLTARSQSKYDKAMAEIRMTVPQASDFVHFIQMDLSSLASVKSAADQISSSTTRLDILVNKVVNWQLACMCKVCV